jgi:hypothetical protein
MGRLLIFSTSFSVLKGWVRRIRILIEHAVVYMELRV